MQMKLLKPLTALTGAIVSLTMVTGAATAATPEELAAMQKQLNKSVMDAPFTPAQMNEVEQYIKQGMEKDLKPEAKTPSYWRPGYTCADIYSYGWTAYRNCRYYHSYYGYYWR